MTDTIGGEKLTAMLSAAVTQIRDNEGLLSQLDAATGDGDHGSAMVKAVNAIAKAVDEWDGESLKGLMHAAGWGTMCIDGGSTGPLFGSLLMGMSASLEGVESLDAAGVAGMFEAGLAKLAAQSKAQVGDKTMMDALIPAVGALRAAADGGAGIDEAMAQAADAATKGAEATTDMLAKYGRARNLGDRVIGHVDPGATSMSLMFKAFSAALAS